MHDAVESENVEHVRRCLNAGLSADTTFRGKAPLMTAIEVGAPGDVLRCLIDAGADVNQRYARTGEDALHFAGKWGAGPEVIDLLLVHGADIDTRDRYGFTPLMMAAGSAARSGTVEVLLSRGANPDLRNDHEQSALDIMRLNDRAYGPLFEKYRRTTAE